MKIRIPISRSLHIRYLLAVAALACAAIGSTLSAAEPSAKERDLIAVLAGDAPAADKALACKNLAVHGSEAAVPELAKLLADERLSSWSRIALEAIPGAAADAALRQGADSLQGPLLVGVLNSLGVRRDAAAVEILTKKLSDQDAEVASAAAAALGHVGDAAATKTLRGALASAPAKVRSAVAEGCILCAEKLLAAGQADEAAAIYDEVRKAEVPKQRRIEAVRGAILARQEQGLDLLVEQLRSPDKAFFQVGLGVSRQIASKKVDELLATELGQAAPERAPLLLLTMADRKETIVLAAVVKAAEGGAKEVRLAALSSLGKVGDASCLNVLLTGAADKDADVAQAARGALAALPDPKVDADIVARLAKADAKAYPVLLEVIGERRIDAVPALLKAVDHSDATVRAAALTALGNTIPAKNLAVLINAAVKPKHAEDGETALLALKAACIRMPDREACAEQLAKAIDGGSTGTKSALLPIVAAVGGTKALAAVGAAAKNADDKIQDVSSRLLGEWSTIDAAPVLLDLSKSAPSEKYQTRALRGYIRIARQFVMPEPQRLEMCRHILDGSSTAEHKMVLDILKRYPSVETLKLSVKIGQNPQLKDDASQASLAIAAKLGGKGAEVLEALSKAGLSKVKLEIVKAEYGAGSTQKDVTATLRKHASDSQLVTLAAATFNEAFGGDPAPSTVKQLRIQYRIDGKAGEATFAENALIVLPMPK